MDADHESRRAGSLDPIVGSIQSIHSDYEMAAGHVKEEAAHRIRTKLAPV